MGYPTEKEMNEMHDYYMQEGYDSVNIKKVDDFKNCKHPYRKLGCCDICGEDLIGE